MEPRIRYANTSDGVSIAYTVWGQGGVTVEMQPLLVTHLEMEWQIPGLREAQERASRIHTLVRHDARGSGLSDRDVTDFSVEALVRDLEAVDARMGRSLASGISDARLAIIEGRSVIPASQDADAMQRAIDEFLGAREEAAETAALPSGTAVILFADIADSTGLTEQMGDTAFREKARELDGALRAVIRDSGGTPVEGKLLGDGVLAVFTSARQAIEAALGCAQAGNHGGLPLHVGVHAGDVIREEDNVYGGAVNIAARVSALSAAGEVLVSETVRGLARTSAGVSFEDRGEQSLKGVAEPVRVWAVREGEA